MILQNALVYTPRHTFERGTIVIRDGRIVPFAAPEEGEEVLDNAKVDEKAVKAAGAAGVIRPSKNACQVIIGTKVQFVYDELKKML